MKHLLHYLRHSLVSKLTIIVGLTVTLSISVWAYFNTKNLESQLMNNILDNTHRLATSIKLGTHYAMTLNSRDDINQIINNIAKQPEIENIRIYNKEGQIKFSNQKQEIDMITNIKDEACYICHRTEPPSSSLDFMERIRLINSKEGYRLLGIIDPIINEPGCSSDSCHIHPENKKILGALDVVVSLKQTDMKIKDAERAIMMLAVFIITITSVIIFFSIFLFVSKPIKKLINSTKSIAEGDYNQDIDIGHDYEIGSLATAINQMGKEIGTHQSELNKQKNEYQSKI